MISRSESRGAGGKRKGKVSSSRNFAEDSGGRKNTKGRRAGRHGRLLWCTYSDQKNAGRGRPGMGRWYGMTADDVCFSSLSLPPAPHDKFTKKSVDRPLSPSDCAAAFRRSTQNRRPRLRPSPRPFARSLARSTDISAMREHSGRTRARCRASCVCYERGSHGEDTRICQKSAIIIWPTR